MLNSGSPVKRNSRRDPAGTDYTCIRISSSQIFATDVAMLRVVTAVYGMAWCHATDVTEAPGHQGTRAL